MTMRAALALMLAAPFLLAPAGQSVSTDPITLPDEINYPEGIAYDPSGRAIYVAATGTGRIAKVDLKNQLTMLLGKGIAKDIGGVFPGVLGMRLDGKRLWMAGGRSAKIFVADAKTGDPLATITTQSDAPGLINDVAIVGKTAYFTDTLHPTLWTVSTGGKTLPGAATPWLSFTGTPLEYGEGANLNGIVATPDGKALIVGQMNKGLLFRIDLATKAVTAIDLKGETLEGADGLVLKGDILFVVRQTVAEIVTIRLAPGYGSGTVLKRSKPPGLRWPATAATDGKVLMVVNSQFDASDANPATRPFTISRVPLTWLMP
jgi:DNA-binding beta-propeller fold protein YncE